MSALVDVGYLPHGFCLTWRPGLLWTMVSADVVIALAYFSIPLAILSFMRRRPEASLVWLASLFCAFIFACGLTHVMDVWTIWRPDYGVQVLVKGLTAAISAVTAVGLWWLIPQALGVPSVSRLQTVISSLAAEVEKGQSADRKFRDLLESAPDAMVIVNRAGEIVLVNSQTVQLFGWTHEELLGRSVDVLVPRRYVGAHPAHRGGFFTQPKVRQMGAGLDLYGLRKDSSEFPVEISLSPIQTDEGLLIASAIRDATERKRSERLALNASLREVEVETARKLMEVERQARLALEASLREKEVLLKEIHHRVKNNLQVISSLLELQSGYVENADTRRAFQDSEGRIRSMAMVHEKLYKGKDLVHLDFGDYLRDLVAAVSGSHRVHAEQVTIEVEAEPLPLDIDRATLCGLVVNELVSNSFKHGFPDGRRGRIEVRLERYGDAAMRVSVQDDGVGWAEGFDPAASSSLGLQLVHILSRQLRGQLYLSGDGGVSCALLLQAAPG